ncbi:hypothetical protein [Bizionia arctica]|uniref:Uncharacterized protein n=1 Tax=Bizionia arctica TaxID=1495645 RepID=A0A917LS30_9FLAO|nr:hypothetical protein [Bizionia arctica]GGG52361.1 hypothetical protein GCM10010976_24380 [Bizionia arctica]
MKKNTLIILTLMLSTMNLFAQANEDKYLRSSLSMILIETDDFPEKNAVMESWNNYPFPDKYNEHDIDLKSININSIQLTDDYLLEKGYLQDTLDNPLKLMKATAVPVRYLNVEQTIAVVIPTDKQIMQLKIDKVLEETGLGKQLISSWFNRSSDGIFDMSLIQERGFYNASEMEAALASGQVRGMAALADAGAELIKNTFVTFTSLEFNPNEPVAAAVRDAAKQTASESNLPSFVLNKTMKGIDAVYEKTKEGYFVSSKTWLFQLAWDESIATTFYSDLYTNPAAFDVTDIFKLEFVGVQYNQSLVTFKIGEKRTLEQVIDLALVRNVDNAFAELQKDNDVFKPATPISYVDPFTAKIGLKEGISAGDKFEVLEMVWDEKTGQTSWKKVGTCTVDKKAPIWDNRYAQGEDTEPQTDEDGNIVTATTFKGSSNIEVGMLLKQVK